MVNRIIIFLALLIPISMSGGEPVQVQNFEGELWLGIGCPFAKEADRENIAGFDIGIELRYNLKRIPVAVGVKAESMNMTRREDGLSTNFSYGSYLFGLTGEYNFRRGRRCNPFVGAAVGAGNIDDGCGHSFWRPFFQPQVGIELFQHLRIKLSVLVTKRESCGMAISIGGVIGGRKKKTDN